MTPSDDTPSGNPVTDSGATRFRPFSNPATGELVEFTAPTGDRDADIVRFKWRSRPGAAITEHVHPHQDERFTIIDGEAQFTVEGKQRLVRAGEAIVVPVGIRHSMTNTGPTEIEGVVELYPALRSRQLHEAFGGLACEGKTTGRGAPKNPLQLGATLWHFRHENRVTSPPIWVQNLILPPLWALAKLCGVRPYHERWDSRTIVAPKPAG